MVWYYTQGHFTDRVSVSLLLCGFWCVEGAGDSGATSAGENAHTPHSHPLLSF
jgi:hypothetical protein